MTLDKTKTIGGLLFKNTNKIIAQFRPTQKRFEGVAKELSMSRDCSFFIFLTLLIFFFVPNARANDFPADWVPWGEFASDTWYMDRIKAWEALSFACGEGVVIAQLDSGVDYNHPALKDRLLMEDAYNFGDNSTDVMDHLGHGTGMAGIILQVSPCAQIIPLKINPAGENFFETEALERALWYILDLAERIPGLKIVNMSLTVSEMSEGLDRVVGELHREGFILVTAAGNDGTSAQPLCQLPEVMCVGGLDEFDQRLASSNYGHFLTLSAPATSLYAPALGGTYLYYSGTSGAAALVSSVLTLAASANPKAHLRLDIASSSQDLGPGGFDEDFGFGVPSALEALFAVLGEKIFCFPSEVVLSPQEEKTLFFTGTAPVSAFSDQSGIYQFTGMSQQGETSLIGVNPGEGDLYLYQEGPFAIKKIKVHVVDPPYLYLEPVVYPLDINAGWLGMWTYLSLSDPLEDPLKLSFTYWKEQEGYRKVEISLYEGDYFQPPFYLDTLFILRDTSFFPQGLYESFLIPQDSVEDLVQKRAFFIKP